MLGRRADPGHPQAWWWCIEPSGRYGLALYGVSGRDLPTDLSELKGMSASIRKQSDGTHFLLMLLESGADWELFYALCVDLVESTEKSSTADDAVDVAITRLRRWQRFLSRGRKPGLTEEEARGLLAELLFLHEVLVPRSGISASVQGWAGPEGHPQDFAIGEHVFEIKSRLPSARQVVEITSAEQLESTSEEFYLVVQELSPAPAGTVGSITLAQVIASIRGLTEAAGGEVAMRFEGLLSSVGYEDGEKYGETTFLSTDRRYFHVTNDFPRIVRSLVPSAITRVRYGLDVSQCAGFETGDPWK